MPTRRMAEMCSCLMSKWLVSLFASEIVKLDIKFYERVPGPRPRPRPGPVLVSSALLSVLRLTMTLVVAAAVAATQICPAPVFGHGANFDA